MTLLDTEKIGKKLVKHGFYRSNLDHQHYRYHNIAGGLSVTFVLQSNIWSANFTHGIDMHTTITFTGHQAVFTPEWLVEEHKKLQAMFKFLRG
jgi:hypothetical protein